MFFSFFHNPSLSSLDLLIYNTKEGDYPYESKIHPFVMFSLLFRRLRE